MAKKIAGFVKLQVPAGAAKRSLVGPALDSHGVNLDLTAFCKAFNDQTQDLKKGSVIPVGVTIYQDHTFTLKTRKPSLYGTPKIAKAGSGKVGSATTKGMSVVKSGKTLTTKSGRTIIRSPARSAATSLSSWSDAFKK